ncbi:serine hydrolase [Kordiimonas aestuarii]|uniref:serine hydrolase n=1 Tax=Kordiimonas aestuarii TaxID=1005925 RepID=UPI0021D37C5E|nr:serine hydrolase [Kordiimonas aestuarii]
MVVKRAALTIFLMLVFTSGISAQAIVLRADDVLPRLKAVQVEAFFVNGDQTYGFVQTQNGEADLKRLMLRLAALRLVAEGLLDMDEPVAKFLPDMVNDYPFKVALTLRHLLTGTAGFATPPGGLIQPDITLRSYTIELRTPGQVATDDIVGDAVLAALLEQASGKPLANVFDAQLHIPLGRPLAPALGRVLLHNETAGGQAFLTPEIYRLIAAESLWRLHPMGPLKSAVGAIKVSHGLAWLEVAPGIIAFPREGVVFMAPGIPGEAKQRFHNIVMQIARENFPPHTITGPREEARRMVPPTEVGGRYTRSDKPSAWLQSRARTMAADWMTLSEENDGSLTLSLAQIPDRGGDAAPQPFDRSFHEVVPYRYENKTGDVLTLSPYRMGGYAYLGDALYRYTGPLGHMDFIASIAPWVFAALLTAAFHLKSPVGRPWRRMAAFALIGTGLIGGALLAEWYAWPGVMYALDLPILVTLWRIGLNVGLMLILAIPLLAMSFVRRGLMPEKGVAILVAGPHLALLSFAAMALFLITVALGLAGDFSAL